MKYLIVFYSRTKTTKKVAKAIATILDNANIEEIIDTKDRSGAMGYLYAGKDAMQKNLTVIKNTQYDPEQYDVVILGTPVWSFNMSAPIRTYVTFNKHKFKNVAFFCTQGSAGSKNTFQNMEELCEKEPACTLDLKTRQVFSNQYSDKLQEFINKIRELLK